MSGLDLSIDRVTRSRKNLFTSVRLDRLAEYRDDPEWLRRALESDAARFVPLWRGRNLLAMESGEQVAVYPGTDELSLPEDGPRPTLLGTDGKRYFFALSVGEAQKERLLEINHNARFIDLRLASIDMDAKHAGVLAYAKALLYWQ